MKINKQPLVFQVFYYASGAVKKGAPGCLGEYRGLY